MHTYVVCVCVCVCVCIYAHTSMHMPKRGKSSSADGVVNKTGRRFDGEFFCLLYFLFIFFVGK